MSKANEPAFPVEYGEGCLMLKAGERPRGLSKREYFAAKAMQGILAATVHAPYVVAGPHIPQLAVQHADALLAELAKGEK